MTQRRGVPGFRVAVAVVIAVAASAIWLGPDAQPSESLDALTARRLACPDWRIRYCLALDGSNRNADRVVLEQLIRDTDERVANQASVRYLGRFVRVDAAFLREHVALYYELPVGGHYPGRPDITSPEFHRSMLGTDLEAPVVAGSIRVLGLIGSAADVERLAPFAASPNPYVAVVAAVAIARLGDETAGVATLRRIVERPIASQSDVHHQTDALRLLAELDPAVCDELLPAFAARADGSEHTTPRHWWDITRLVWERES